MVLTGNEKLMKELKLSNSDKVALVDDEDLERLSKFNWTVKEKSVTRPGSITKDRLYAQGRQVLNIRLANEVMNRMGIMFDHADRNFLNNQKNNLREATKQQNAQNSSKILGTICNYKGVYFEAKRNKFKCAIRFNGKLIHLGYFSDELEAAKMYDSKALELFKEFASINFPPNA